MLTGRGKCRSGTQASTAPCSLPSFLSSRIPLVLAANHYSSLLALARRICPSHPAREQYVGRAVLPYPVFTPTPNHICYHITFATPLQRVMTFQLFKLSPADLVQIQARRGSGLHVRQTRSRLMASRKVRTMSNAPPACFPPQSPFDSHEVPYSPCSQKCVRAEHRLSLVARVESELDLVVDAHLGSRCSFSYRSRHLSSDASACCCHLQPRPPLPESCCEVQSPTHRCPKCPRSPPPCACGVGGDPEPSHRSSACRLRVSPPPASACHSPFRVRRSEYGQFRGRAPGMPSASECRRARRLERSGLQVPAPSPCAKRSPCVVARVLCS